MPKILEGKLVAEGKKFGLIASRFNDFITDRLVGGAMDALVRSGAKDTDIEIVKVPGAFEIPLLAKKMAKKGKYDAIICLGAVIRGSTSHYDYVCAEASKGIAMVSIESEIPVIFGILTTDTIEQAIERAGTKAGNKGWKITFSKMTANSCPLTNWKKVINQNKRLDQQNRKLEQLQNRVVSK